MVKFRIFIPELWDFIHQIVCDFKAIFRMSCCNLRTPWPIHFKFRIVIGIDSLMVCILFGEISIFHSRVMGLYSSNCRRFFVCRAVIWEPLGQFTSNFTQLLELIVLWSVYFLVKFRFFIQELWERKSTNIVWMLTTGVLYKGEDVLSCKTCIWSYCHVFGQWNMFKLTFYWITDLLIKFIIKLYRNRMVD